MMQEGSTKRAQAISGWGWFVHLAHDLSSECAPSLGAANFVGFPLYSEALWLDVRTFQCTRNPGSSLSQYWQYIPDQDPALWCSFICHTKAFLRERWQISNFRSTLSVFRYRQILTRRDLHLFCCFSRFLSSFFMADYVKKNIFFSPLCSSVIMLALMRSFFMVGYAKKR